MIIILVLQQELYYNKLFKTKINTFKLNKLFSKSINPTKVKKNAFIAFGWHGGRVSTSKWFWGLPMAAYYGYNPTN